MDWKHGYFAESGYTYGYYPETSPARLAWIAAIKGSAANLERFRYLDLGCGQGFSLIQMAAFHPNANFIGVDFMPEHISHAQRLAQDAGLTNVQFIEGDFVELAKDPSALGTFDYAVAHGISTWISEEVREAMFRLTEVVLKPGGLMYNSYNTYPGWLHAAPFQNLVLELQKRNNGMDALLAAKAIFKKLQEAGSAVIGSLPGLEARLERMSKFDLAYLVQEYNNQSWQPVFSNEMLEIAQRHKLAFLGSATLPELFDGNYPENLRSLINEQTDPIAREALRDLAVFQSFRRDVYVKGAAKLWSGQQVDSIQKQRFVANAMKSLPKEDETFTWTFGTTTISGDRQRYMNILEAFGEQGKSVGEVMTALNEPDLPKMVQRISLLLHSNWLALEGKVSSPQAPRLNMAVAQAVIQGAAYQWLCAPKLQTALNISDIDFLLIGLAKKGESPEVLAKKLVQTMLALGKRFVDNGSTIEDSAQMPAYATKVVTSFLNERQKYYHRLGAL